MLPHQHRQHRRQQQRRHAEGLCARLDAARNRTILYGANLPMLVKLAKSRKMTVADAVALAKDAGRKYINSYDVAPADVVQLSKRAAS